MSKTKRPYFSFLSPEEIKKELSIWERDWEEKKISHPNFKLIESKLKILKNDLKKREITNSDSFLDGIKISGLYGELLALSKINDVSYENELLFAPTSDAIKIFKKHESTFDDKKYWRELASVYIQQNYKKIAYSTYYKLFSAKRMYREELMNDEERNVLNSLPEFITIYRGGSFEEENSKKYGISWTLNKQTAEKFCDVKAIRDKKEMKVFELNIPKSHVIAFFNQRKEDEIIYIHM